MNECKAVRDLLALRPEEWSDPECRRVREHLAACPDCAALARAYAEQDRLIRAAPRLRLTSAQRAQLFSRIRQEKAHRNVYMRLSTVAGAALALVALVALTLGLSTLFQGTDRLTAVPASPSPPPSPRIAFTSWRDGNGEIYLIGADGSGLTRLTDNRGRDSDPIWSPPAGGTRIAFVSWQNGSNEEIYVMQVGDPSLGPHGSEPVNLTNHPATDQAPTWSPDGTQIAFTSWRDGDLEIYKVNADGSGLTNLTNDPAEDSAPAWSPDGRWIAYTSVRDGVPGIYAIPAPGTSAGAVEPIKLTHDPGGGDPIWSPDSTRIAFVSKSDDGDSEIYVLDVAKALQGDGDPESTRLTNNPATDVPIAWSPDGTHLAFESDRDDNREIYVLDVSTLELTRLTDHPADDWAPAWAPDGTRIAFASNRDGNWEIYVINVDGSGLTNLTNHPANDSTPAWQP